MRLSPTSLFPIFLLLQLLAWQSGYAHGFGQIRDLPVPPYLYWFGGGAVVVLSFVIISLVVGRGAANPYRTYNLLRQGWFKALAESRVFLTLIKVTSTLVLFLVISTGFFGSQVSVWNFAPTFVWVIWWVGFGFIHAFVGNVWAVVNPWKSTYELVGHLISPNGEEARPRLRYPTRLGVLPAFILFFTFVWIELVYPQTANPKDVALFTVAYSIVAWVGMLLFGKHVWLRFGEPFSVFFRFLSMFAPTEARLRNREVCRKCGSKCLIEDYDCINCYECYSMGSEREINLRPFALGLLHAERIGLDRVAFIILMLSSVTFDGLSRTYAWFSFIGFDPFGTGRSELIYLNTAGLSGLFLLFLGIYHAFIFLVRLFSRSKVSLKPLVLLFVFSLLPIAMVYHFAHYSTYLLINGQQIIRLISDPFGFQWDLFGTRSLPLSTALDYFSVWHYQVALIVIGHIIAIYVAHVISIRTFNDRRSAIRSQYPMTGLMVMYTIIGLWLLSAPSAA